jgi:hypothetical protein
MARMNLSGLLCVHVLRRSVLTGETSLSAVYGAHLFLVVAFTRHQAAGYGLLDAPQILVGGRCVCSGGVLLQALAALGTGDGYYVLAPL